MNKIVKCILIIVAILIVCLAVFITIDSIRLKNSNIETKPIITISEKIENDNSPFKSTTYYGLGYSINYYSIENTFGSGVNFKLFNVLTLWGLEIQ